MKISWMHFLLNFYGFFFAFTIISIYKLQVAIRYFQTVSQICNCFSIIGLKCYSCAFLLPGKLKCLFCRRKGQAQRPHPDDPAVP